MKDIVLPVILGLDEGMILMMIVSGLSLTFGVMRIVNVAHGGFVALGAYLVFAVTSGFDSAGWALAPAIAIATIAAGGGGGLLERLVFRRLYRMENMATILVTFAMLAGFQGGAVQIWGANPRSVPLPSAVAGPVNILGVDVPVYDLIIIGVAAVVMVLLGGYLYRTRIGMETRAVALDRTMAALLGINTRKVFMASFVVGSALAGLAGALIAPVVAISGNLAGDYVILGFAVLLIAGLGNLSGAIVVAIVFGLIDAFTVVHVPSLTGYAVYIAMVLALVIRPQGFGGQGGEVHV
jgi:branched-subunit amino acid ABC-type transport system permease component